MSEQGPRTPEPHELSSKNAAKILIDTVRELYSYGHTVSDTELSTYAENLGLIDTPVNQNPESEIEEAHKVLHDAKQAEYDKLALEIGPEVSPTNESVKSDTDIYRKTITELATFLGEKPNFQKSKADYIVRAINRRDQLKEGREARNTISATDALGIAATPQSESTQETVRALRAFNKQMLTGSMAIEGTNPVAAETQLPSAAEAVIQLRTEFQTLFDKRQAGELDEAGNKELLSTFAAILAATKAAARAEGKTESEIKQAALDVEREFAQQYGLKRKSKLPLPANDVATSSENIGKGRDQWGTPGRGDLVGSQLDLMTRPKRGSKEKKQHKIRRKLGAAAMGIIALAGLYNLNRLTKDDDSTVNQDKTEQTTTTTSTSTTRVIQNDMVPNDLRVKPESIPTEVTSIPAIVGDKATSVFKVEAGGSPWSWMRTTFGLEGREDVIKQLYEQYKVQLGSLKGAYIDSKSGDVRFNEGSVSIDPAFLQELRVKANQLKNTPRS